MRYNSRMMAITNELIYEVLKSVQAQVAITREDGNRAPSANSPWRILLRMLS